MEFIRGVSRRPVGVRKHGARKLAAASNGSASLASRCYRLVMQMPRVMRRINRAFTNRLMGPLAGRLPPLALAHHVGRKSGRRYRTPVLAFPTDEGFVTPLPYGTDTDWCLNWVEAGEGLVETRGRRTAVANPRIVSADEALPLLPVLLRPGVRLLGLPGFLVVERRVATPRQTQRRRRQSKQRR